MPKLTKEQITEIKTLHESGKKQVELAKMFKVNQSVISYWLDNEDKRKLISQKIMEAFRKKSKEERSLIYKKRLPYLRAYYSRRYHQDQNFRNKEVERSKNYIKRKHGHT